MEIFMGSLMTPNRAGHRRSGGAFGGPPGSMNASHTNARSSEIQVSGLPPRYAKVTPNAPFVVLVPIAF
jgi:hypothetical protein